MLRKEVVIVGENDRTFEVLPFVAGALAPNIFRAPIPSEVSFFISDAPDAQGLSYAFCVQGTKSTLLTKNVLLINVKNNFSKKRKTMV